MNTYVLSWAASTPAAGRWGAHLSVWSLGVLLLHVGIERGVTKICLVAVLALVVTPINVIL